jgi:hypothetical protein
MSNNKDFQPRYILFLLDNNHKEHDGIVFKSLVDAKEYARDCIEDKYCTSFVIGMFTFDHLAERMHISYIESYGLPKDKKQINQLTLF